MNVRKLGCIVTAFRLTNKNVLRLSSDQTPAALPRYKSEKCTSKKDDDVMDKPIKFLNSEAATWNAMYSRTGGDMDDRPWFQTYVIIASVATFLVYFCILREENDIDKKLTLELSDHFEGEKKKNLILSQNLPKKLLEERGLAK